MATTSKPQGKFASLRKRAERAIEKRTVAAKSLKEVDLRRLVHELDVHQVELELQNEELRLARLELEASYNELYDFAPVGYFTLDARGNIAKASLTGASLLGQPRTQLLGRSFGKFVTPTPRTRHAPSSATFSPGSSPGKASKVAS